MEIQHDYMHPHLNSDFKCTSQEVQNDGSHSYHNVPSYAYVVYYVIVQSVNFNALIQNGNCAELLLLWEP